MTERPRPMEVVMEARPNQSLLLLFARPPHLKVKKMGTPPPPL